MNYIAAPPGWCVTDIADREYVRVIAWAACGDCLCPVVVTAEGQVGVMPMPSTSLRLVWDPVKFERTA